MSPRPIQLKRGPDEEVVRKILDNLKNKGVVDNFRKTFLQECDENADFKRLSERVRNTVTSFLKTRTWLPELNKNMERQLVRRRVLGSSYLARELDEMLDRSFSEAESYFMPIIEEFVQEFLGIQKPGDEEEKARQSEDEDNTALIDVERENRKESEAEREASDSASSSNSSMDIDSSEYESDSEVNQIKFTGQLPPTPSLPLGSYYPTLLSASAPFDRTLNLDHPPLPRPLGYGRHIPILSNTIRMRNPVENSPLPLSDSDDDDLDEYPAPPFSPLGEASSSDSESDKPTSKPKTTLNVPEEIASDSEPVGDLELYTSTSQDVEVPTVSEATKMEVSEDASDRDKPVSTYLDGEAIEVLQFLETIPILVAKMDYYSKYTDPLVMDEEVSLDSWPNSDLV